MTTHLSWLSDWPKVDKFESEDVHHTETSEFMSGPFQVADLWERSKVAFELSTFIDADGNAEVLESLLWFKRALHGKSIPCYLAEPFARMLTDEPVGTGDGSQVAWVLPILDPDGGTYPALHLDGVVAGSKIYAPANLLTAEGAMADDSTIWTASGGSVALSSDYRWQWAERCVKGTATGGAVLELDLDGSGHLGDVEIGYDYLGMAHVRGDVTPNVRVGVRWYNSTPSVLSTSWGTGVAVSEGAWTLISSGAQTAPASAAYGSVVVDTVSNATASEVLYLGGVGLSPYLEAAEWWHPNGSPCVAQFAVAPSADDVITYTGRAQAMRRVRAQKDNLKHTMGPRGHASIGRIAFLEDID